MNQDYNANEIINFTNDVNAINIESKELNTDLKIAVIGRPNVGKSSLMNKLIDKNLSIVHDLAGTTRDIIQ